MAILRWALAFLWFAALAAAFFLASGCSAAGVGRPEPVLADDSSRDAPPEEEKGAPQWEAIEDFQAFPEPLRLAPDAEMMAPVKASILRYAARLGLEIVIDPAGIPVTGEEPIIGTAGVPVDGRAANTSRCTWSECNEGHGTTIRLNLALLTREKHYALANSVDHEIGHVVSGWGRAYGGPQHLEDDAKHLMSPGCRNHVCGPWTVEDAGMLCAGAPCTKMDLTAEL